IPPGDMDAAGVRQHEAGDHAQRRRLAAARRAQQGEELAGGDVERHPVDGHHAAVEGLGHIVEADGGGSQRQPLSSFVTRASMSSLRALYHFQSGWISVATLASVVSSLASYLASSFPLVLAGEYPTPSAKSFCVSGRSM